ncbi:MAG: MFS transporter [Dehalococcoidia bacterium]|nr:MFS transporter [Dehalococcoidia bacterium]
MKVPWIFYGWWVVAAGTGITMLSSVMFIYGFGAFFIPWRESFGWSRALLGGVIGLSRLEGGLVAPLSGWIIDRYGTRRIMFLGLGMMGMGFLALSRVNSLLMLYVVFLGLLSIGSSFGTGQPVNVAAANWFIRRRGRAMGLLTAGYGIGGSLVFLLALVIQRYGWRTGAVVAGLAIWAVGFPLVWVIRHKPEDMGLFSDGDAVSTSSAVAPVARASSPASQASQSSEMVSGKPVPEKTRRFWMRDTSPELDLTVWQAIRTPAFWLMTLAWAIWASTPAITTVHLAPYLAEQLKLDYVAAVGALSFFAFASIFGRVIFGFIADYLNIQLFVAMLMIMEGLGLYLFSQIQTMSQVPLDVSVFAVAHGGVIAVRAVIQGYFFGRRVFGTIGGFINFMNLPATVAAPVWMGWLADELPGGYSLGFKIIAATLAVAAVCILLARRPRAPLPEAGMPALLRAFRRGKAPAAAPQEQSTRL